MVRRGRSAALDVQIGISSIHPLPCGNGRAGKFLAAACAVLCSATRRCTMLWRVAGTAACVSYVC